MNIEFPDLHAIDPDSFGIKFPADVYGKQVQCLVTQEALQDINPSGAKDEACRMRIANFKLQSAIYKAHRSEISIGNYQWKQYFYHHMG